MLFKADFVSLYFAEINFFFMFSGFLISFSFLIALATALSTIWKRSGDSGHPCHNSDFNEITVIFFPLFGIIVAFSLWFIDFIMLKYVPVLPVLFSIEHLSESYIEFRQRLFFAFIEMTM